MTLKPNYFVIPAVTVAVALLGSLFTSAGMPWYDTEIIRPALTPPNWAFPIAWTTIYILTAISALICYNKGRTLTKFLHIFTRKEQNRNYSWTIGLFILNAFLNLLWTYLFFTLHLIDIAFLEILLLETTILLLLFFTWRISRIASLLLIPYVAWVAFASFLSYLILVSNI